MKYRSGVAIGLTVVLLAFICSQALVGPVAAQSGRKTESTSGDKKKKELESPDKPKPQQSTQPDQTANPTQGPAGGLSGKPPLKKKADQPIQGSDQDVISLGTNVVNVSVVVYDKKSGKIYTGLKKENFKVFEDGVEQNLTNFSPSDSPITNVVLLEFSKLTDYLGGDYMEYGRNEVLRPTLYFVRNFVQPKDFISIVAYDIRPTPITDFTSDQYKLLSAVNLLFRNEPAFSEANLFDSLKFVLKGGRGDAEVLGKNSDKNYEDYTGLEEVEGRTSILLICSGIDTFSKINYDEARKIVENAGVPIYIIGTGNLFFKKEMGGTGMHMTQLQAQNTLKTFADSSGGAYFPVTFEGELNSTLQNIVAFMRNEYSLGYIPTNTRAEGKRRKIDVHVIIEGQDMTKSLTINHRMSYQEPKPEKEKKKK